MQTDKDLFNLLKETYPLQPKQGFVSSTENMLKQRVRKMTKRHMMKRLSFVSSGIILCVLAFSCFFFFSGKDISIHWGLCY
jgi:stage II sporulation protein P